MLDGKYTEERRTLLAVTIARADGSSVHAPALNEVVVNRGGLGSLIECAVEIDGRFVYAMRADGVIVATPTGTTAYSLSTGGPIIAPEVPAFALVPIAPHALTHRSIAVPDSSTIEITVSRGRDAAVHCDGQARFDLAEGDRVTARRAPHTARFLHPAQHDYFAMLREKLHWSETPERLQHAGGGKRE
jgi:NAD+ kinase